MTHGQPAIQKPSRAMNPIFLGQYGQGFVTHLSKGMDEDLPDRISTFKIWL
jgi:hypothetical protein